MKIAVVASEAAPFVKTGGLGDVMQALPLALSKQKNTYVSLFLPYYSQIKYSEKWPVEFLGAFDVPLAWRREYVGIFRLKTRRKKLQIYFIDNEHYFNRGGIYGFADDGERYAYFSKAVLAAMNYLEFRPDVVSCHDWQAALIPLLLKTEYHGCFPETKSVFTIHNIQYQGKYGMDVLNEVMGIPMYHANLLEYDGCINMMKGAFETADKITTVSPSYAWEILDPWYAHGLDRALANKQYKLCGFLNGIDTKLYDPEKDPLIPAHFSADDISGKEKCKEALEKELKLAKNGEPIIGIVTRFVSHKGIDLIKYVFEEMVNMGCRFAILGSGEKIFEDFFKEMAWRYPDRVSATIGFVPDLARRIYAGADMFLMPSQSEPCGLAQMISMRYGTIPIVRETGGLRDSVRDAGGENGNGFTFKTYNAHDMLNAVCRAYEYYKNKPAWAKLVSDAMKNDFSWDSSAKLYIGLYKELAGEE